MAEAAALALNTGALILDAARSRLLADGYAGLSTRKVADEAGVPVSQLHYHFGSKQGLILALFAEENRRRLDRQCGADLLRRPAGRGGGHGVDRADQPGRPGRPHRAAVACPAVGPVVPGLGAPARRGCLAVRSGIPQSGSTMNQSAMASRLRGSRMRRGPHQLSRSTLRRYVQNFWPPA